MNSNIRFTIGILALAWMIRVLALIFWADNYHVALMPRDVFTPTPILDSFLLAVIIVIAAWREAIK